MLRHLSCFADVHQPQPEERWLTKSKSAATSNLSSLIPRIPRIAGDSISVRVGEGAEHVAAGKEHHPDRVIVNPTLGSV